MSVYYGIAQKYPTGRRTYTVKLGSYSLKEQENLFHNLKMFLGYYGEPYSNSLDDLIMGVKKECLYACLDYYVGEGDFVEYQDHPLIVFFNFSDEMAYEKYENEDQIEENMEVMIGSDMMSSREYGKLKIYLCNGTKIVLNLSRNWEMI